MAYTRGVFAVLLLFGFLVIAPGIMVLNGKNLDEFALTAVYVQLAMLVTGVLGGSLTYLFGRESPRDREIRLRCGELLGVAIDPARTTSKASKLIAGACDDAVEGEKELRTQMIRGLVLTRAMIGQKFEAEPLEAATDELLAKLSQLAGDEG
ncbi:hypothetical protein [Limnoglobus roseus]|nr:hypothetical protein [Limnoglobus roseus]